MIALGSVQFASAWALLLLLLLPAWWIVRRRRRPSAIVFSRVSVLAAGPRAGRATTLLLFTLRNLLLASMIVALSRPRSGAHAQDVTITPLGAVDGEFCVGDRALLFEDPTGVRVLIAPGRTVRGSTDSRLPQPGTAGGSVHVVLIDHPQTSNRDALDE